MTPIEIMATLELFLKVKIDGKIYESAVPNMQFVEVPSTNPVPPEIPPVQVDLWSFLGQTVDPSIWRDNPIHALKSQWGGLSPSGDIVWHSDQAGRDAQAKEFKAHSEEQYFDSVSFSAPNIDAMLKNKRPVFINTVLAELHRHDFTGFELDLEGFEGWTKTTMDGMILLINELAAKLHKDGFKLHMALPAQKGKGAYPSMVDFERIAATTIDKVAIMTYDGMYAAPVETSPNAPLEWIKECTAYAISVFGKERVIGGIPNYGYHAPSGQNVTKLTTILYGEAQNLIGFNSAVRDPGSGELKFTQGGRTYWITDSEAMRIKRAAIQSVGVNTVSVWSAGGGIWFN